MHAGFRSGVRRLLREPLVHFVLLGGLAFLAFEWRGGGAGSRTIVVTAGQVEALVAGFTRTWQRPPDEDELEALLRDRLREEVAVREAMAEGLDRDDTVIRRRLRQKWEFLREDEPDAVPPSEAELAGWLESHAEDYAVDARVALRHVVLTPDRRGPALEQDAQALLERLMQAGPQADLSEAGDLRSLPDEIGLVPLAEVEGLLGEEVARAAAVAEPGRWTGPVRSGYGLHLILVTERAEGRAPALDEVRAAVERDVLADRRRRRMEALYEELLAGYDVRIERPAAPVAGAPP